MKTPEPPLNLLEVVSNLKFSNFYSKNVEKNKTKTTLKHKMRHG